MNERYIKWHTPWLNREFEMLALGNGGGLPLILFPTSFGRYYQNKDFGLVGSLSGYGLSEILNSKGVKHWLDDGKWRGHDWNYWRDMLPHYLSVL
jgi:esterase/lipase superfamily enzyme